MRVESVLTGRHNQVVISAHLHERHDSNVDITGDVERKFIAGSVAKLYLASAAFAISQEGGFNLEERKHITLSDFAKGIWSDDIIKIAIQKGSKFKQSDGYLAVYKFYSVAYKII